MRDNPIVIGLTGNIATGKSIVLAMLAQRGARVIDADQLAHQILASDPAVQQEIIARFGPGVRNADGTINRAELGARVFGNPAGMRDLESIVHPRVGQQVSTLIAGAGAAVVVIEAIKLLEGDLRHRCQSIWVTDCPEEQQLARLVAGRQMTPEQAWTRIRSQPPQAAKLAQADVIIDTSGNIESTEEQVEQAWRNLPSIRAE